MSFDDLGLSPEVLKAVADAGYTTPTPIQRQAIPTVLMGRDVLGCAQTGTGKTAGFTLPMIDILAGGRARARMPRSLILEPTRELAQQVAESFEKYGKHNKLNMALLIGGTSLDDQKAVLQRGVDVLIATPGRLLDLFDRGQILLADCKLLVIDEADRMLDMGFIPDIEKIVGRLPQNRQTLFFSATMPPEIRRLADKFLSNPKAISVDPPASAAVTVTQALIRTSLDPKVKREALRTLLRSEEVASALIFCNRKRDVALLHKSLERHGFNAKALHGDMSQPARTETLEAFRAGKIQLLVCSDVAARGLDIPAVSHVFNFDVPIHSEDYIHRIGRTGRAGRSGKAFTLATPADSKFLASIRHMTKVEIPELTLDGIAAPVPGEAPAREERRGRGRAEPKGEGRGERRARGPRRERAPQVETAPLPLEAPEPVAALEPEAAPEAVVAEIVPARPRREGRESTRRNEPRREAGPREERSHEEGRRGRRGEPRDERGYAQRAEERGDRDRHPSNDPHHPTASFGDHTPAFLLRPARAVG
jgi:superfamily II DNA/RNA helicase